MAADSIASDAQCAAHFWVRTALVNVALLCSPWTIAGPAMEADLQMLEYFGVSDIAVSNGGSGPVAGIQQTGDGNRASIEQSGGNSLAQVWQQGDNNFAKVVQDGSWNELRLWQEGSDHSANLSQSGTDNKISAVQYGSGSTLEGAQNGVGNVAALVLNGGSKFSFTQNGNYNTIEQTMPVMTSLEIIQNGNGMAAHFLPTNSMK